MMLQPSDLRQISGLSPNLQHVSLSAVRSLQLELNRFERRAEVESKDLKTHSLGLLRKDLVQECRHRLMFITYMVKDAKEHSNGRKRPSSEQ
jgi:hypothetical protein